MAPENRFKFKHVNAITGTFVLLGIVLVIAVVFLAGRSQRWFITNVNLRIILPEEGAAGIRQGSEVYFLGTLMGTVSDVSVDPAGRMEAQVNIRRDFFLFVRADSSAVVKRKFGVVGDAYFEITRGHGEPLPEENASIVCNEQLPSALESAVEEVRREAVPALVKLSSGLDTWTRLGTNFFATEAKLNELITNVNAIAIDLRNGKGTAGQLLTDTGTVDEFKMALEKANSSLDELQAIMKNLEKASGNIEMASTNLPAISEALGNEAKDLPGLVLQAHTSMREMERLIEGMQRHWLIRRYMEPREPGKDESEPSSQGVRQRVIPRPSLRQGR